MNSPLSTQRHRVSAFTLVEVMVSLALICLIMAMLLNTVNSTQQLWQKTSAKASQFQAAREGFEAMTRRLSQATLNTYYRAYDRDTSNSTAELQFRRQSELQFMSGPTFKIFNSPAMGTINPEPEFAYPTHSVFFQAPLGYTEYQVANKRPFGELDSLLTGCGYFIEYGDDPDVPDFVRQAGVPPRRRFRLNELSVPGEKLNIFARQSELPRAGDIIYPQVSDIGKKDYLGLVDKDGHIVSSFLRPFWLLEGLRRQSKLGVDGFVYARPLAENVVALVILPKLAPKDQANSEAIGQIAPEYAYDSWRILRLDKKTGAANAARDHILPPIVQVTMVAIDEPSAQRLAVGSHSPPKWTDGLFQTVHARAEYTADLTELEKRLQADPKHISYRVFSADIVLRGSKWSQTAQ